MKRNRINRLTEYLSDNQLENKNPVDPFLSVQAEPHGFYQERRAPKQSIQQIFKAEFPNNYYMPDDAKSVDLRNRITVGAGATANLITFKAQEGHLGVFYEYALESPSLLKTDQLFKFLINNRPIQHYHGDPTLAGTPINLATGTDLTLNSLVRCQIKIKPQKTLLITVQNLTVGPLVFGARLVGYVDPSIERHDERTIG